MFLKTIALLEGTLRANNQIIDSDSTDVTPDTKEQCRIWADELELAIAMLRHCQSSNQAETSKI